MISLLLEDRKEEFTAVEKWVEPQINVRTIQIHTNSPICL